VDIKTVGVVGFGAMGSGIAQVCAQSGYSVIVSDMNDEFIAKGLALINAFLTKSVEKGKVTPEQKEAILKRVTGTTDIKNFKDCSVVIEAVNENLDLKKNIFSQLGKICSEQTVLATNTSTLSVIDIGSTSGRLENVVGMHFFIPPPLMRPVELVRTLATSEQIFAKSRTFLESLGKEVIVTKDLPGFIVDRISIADSINAIRLLESGVGSVEDIDKAITMGLNHPLGPFALIDMVGLDILVAGAKSLHEQTGDPQWILPVTVSKMVAAGWLGRKTGKGFYDYRKSEKK
jgi:3-hydroxybutyryl-CoA dehydrogenase